MKSRPSAVAQKLLNLYRQQHVILGGWGAVNRVFVAEADDDVMALLPNLPTGGLLVRHIENLRAGKTPMDSIAADLMPYGGLMTESAASASLSDDEVSRLRAALDSFSPDPDGLAQIQSMYVVKKFGAQWQGAIRSALADHSDLLEKWNNVVKTSRAYYLWDVASSVLSSPVSDRARAQVQADLPEYETYLPMFGESGTQLLSKLRIYVSNI
jgi:hypothetical protein